MYDVVVIGAGPAGSTAAKTLADRGLRVLLAERLALPRYKSCSGILIQKSLDLIRQYYGGQEVPAQAACTPVQNRGMVFTDDKGREHRFPQGGLNIWRGPFDGWLAKQAEQAGAVLRDNTNIPSWEEGREWVALPNGERSRYVIDCGGVTGLTRRRAVGRDYITTFQTFSRGTIQLDPHYFYAYLQPELSEYDAWFNVKDEQLVLGVSVRDQRNIERFYRRFLQYMTDRHGLHIDEQLRSEKWLMPRVRPGCPILYGQGRTLLAGETAGFLNPMGEGISAALESGYHAACAIADCFSRPEEALLSYQERTAPLKAYMERQWAFTARLAGTFSNMLAPKTASI